MHSQDAQDLDAHECLRVLCVKGKIRSAKNMLSFLPSIKLLKQSTYNLIDNECIRVVGAIRAVEGLQFYALLEMCLDLGSLPSGSMCER
jgi:hypothetical protein